MQSHQTKSASKTNSIQECKAATAHFSQETFIWPDCLTSFPDGRFCIAQGDTIYILSSLGYTASNELSKDTRDRGVAFSGTREQSATRQLFKIPFPAHGLTVSSSGNLITAHKNNTIQVWDITTEKNLLTLNVISSPECLTINQNYLICGHSTNSGGGFITFWKLNLKSIKKSPPLPSAETSLEEPVFAINALPDGNRLVSGHQDGVVCLWDIRDVNNPKKINTFKNVTGNQINSLVPIITDEEHLAVSDLSGDIILLNLTNGAKQSIGSHAPLYTYITLLPSHQLGYVSQNIMGNYDLSVISKYLKTRKSLEKELLPTYFAPGVDQIVLDYYAPNFFTTTPPTKKSRANADKPEYKPSP